VGSNPAGRINLITSRFVTQNDFGQRARAALSRPAKRVNTVLAGLWIQRTFPRLTNSRNKYHLPRAIGQAANAIAGKDQYLGPHGSTAGNLKHDRLMAQWLAAGRQVAPPEPQSESSIVEVLADHWEFTKRLSQKNETISVPQCMTEATLDSRARGMRGQ
jgi:hypothetical protein